MVLVGLSCGCGEREEGDGGAILDTVQYLRTGNRRHFEPGNILEGVIYTHDHRRRTIFFH